MKIMICGGVRIVARNGGENMWLALGASAVAASSAATWRDRLSGAALNISVLVMKASDRGVAVQCRRWWRILAGSVGGV